MTLDPGGRFALQHPAIGLARHLNVAWVVPILGGDFCPYRSSRVDPLFPDLRLVQTERPGYLVPGRTRGPLVGRPAASGEAPPWASPNISVNRPPLPPGSGRHSPHRSPPSGRNGAGGPAPFLSRWPAGAGSTGGSVSVQFRERVQRGDVKVRRCAEVEHHCHGSLLLETGEYPLPWRRRRLQSRAACRAGRPRNRAPPPRFGGARRRRTWEAGQGSGRWPQPLACWR